MWAIIGTNPRDANDELIKLDVGWYWWPCFPPDVRQDLPDDDPNGPYETEQAAIASAQDESAGVE